MKILPLTAFVSWLTSGDRGLSSDAIVSRLTNRPVGDGHWNDAHPYDPDDLNRCMELLDLYPEARREFDAGAMRAVSPQWAALTNHWSELEALLREEQGVQLRRGWRAPRCYARMGEILDACERGEG